jgi:hypothetical protein
MSIQFRLKTECAIGVASLELQISAPRVHGLVDK